MNECGFADFVPYALLFAGIGFMSAVVVIVVMANADPLLDKFLTAGYFSKRKQASQQASKQASQPARPAIRTVELGMPMRDPKYVHRPRSHKRPFLNKKHEEA